MSDGSVNSLTLSLAHSPADDALLCKGETPELSAEGLQRLNHAVPRVPRAVEHEEPAAARA